MKKLLFSIIGLAGILSVSQVSAQTFTENFQGGIPATWVRINDANVPYGTSTTGLTAAAIAKMTANSWDISVTKGTADQCAFSCSFFNPPGTADRWLITHAFTVAAGQWLTWEDFSIQTPADSLEVWVSPTAGTVASAFTTKIYSGPAPDANVTGTTANLHLINMAAYAGQNIRVGFREHSTAKLLVYLDNVSLKTVPSAEMALTSLTPAGSSPLAYGLVGSSVTFKGTVQNNGSSAITSYTLSYKVGSGSVVSMPISGSIPALGSGTFSATTPYTIGATGSAAVKAWVTLSGDANHANDSGATTIVGVTSFPSKKLVVEEATGSWCGWCVRGAVYMDSMWKVHPSDISLVAVHNADPMTVTAYDNIIKIPGFSGYPSIVIDRREIADPSNIFDVYTAEKSYFGFADVTMGKATTSGTNVSVPVVVKPATNLSGDYRLCLVITEDRVNNASGGTWDQHNYYGGQANSGNYVLPTSSTFGDFHTLPSVIPSATYYYDFVGRGGFPDIAGGTGTLPATMNSGTAYTATLTATMDPSWVHSKTRGVVLLIDHTTGQILNSANSRWPLAVENVKAGIDEVSIVPNPAKDFALVNFNLANASDVTVQVVDAMGRTVSNQASHMNAGAQNVRVNLNTMAAGVYNVVIRTEAGNVSQTLSVVK